jgi:hypothetical protein
MPDEDQLPSSPKRDLVAAVHRLYQLAGKPSVRKISGCIKDRDDLPGTLSHEGVSAVLRGNGGVPRWPNLASLVKVLAEDAIVPLDIEHEILHVHALWVAVDGVVLTAPSAGPGSAVDQVGEHAVQGVPTRIVDVVIANGLASTREVLGTHRKTPAVDDQSVGDEVPALYNPATGMLRMKVTLSRELSWIRDFGEDGSDA